MIEQWFADNDLQYTWILQDKLFELDNKLFAIIKPKDGKLFDENFELILDDDEIDLLNDATHYCFKFGSRYYYSAIDSDRVELNELKYLGKANNDGFTYLGIHGGYELCNGSRRYEDWCKKAKFLQVETLGICERNTLAGVLQFQLKCKEAGIKPIIGESVVVKTSDKYTYTVKLYCKDEKGWNNLLWINKAINVDSEDHTVEESYLLERLHGLVVVLGSDVLLTDRIVTVYQNSDLFYQIDPVKWSSVEKDKKHLDNIKHYYNKYVTIRPMVICDSYYLDKADSEAKDLLNKIGKIGFEHQSKDQYFKSTSDCFLEITNWFKGRSIEQVDQFVDRCFESLCYVNDNCNFQIETGKFYLPQYQLSEQERLEFKDEIELFWHLIDEGMQDKVISKGKDVDLYFKRVELEYEVIDYGKLQSYFLILYDIIKWSKQNDIMVGYGRGSVGGSLIAMLLGITEVDPIEHDLIFERFLTKERVSKSLPDIDTDFEASRREEVKRYMEQRYGVDNVCSIGTYGTFKLKAALKDVCRVIGVNPGTSNYMSAMLNDGPKFGKKFIELFQSAVQRSQLRDFVVNYTEQLDQLPLFLNQPKNSSVHAAGVVITPRTKDDRPMTIYDWLPVKKIDGILVSEWEGPQLERTGLLKEDILGLSELDKFHEICELVLQNYGVKLDLNKIDLTDQHVFDLFKKGYTQDIFQFGTKGLTSYVMEVQPSSIDELGAINSLYRPGAMESNMHKDYVNIKFGRKDAEYNWGTEEILSKTYGLMIFQENTMKVFQTVGGFSLAESDDIRGAIGKKDMKKMSVYKEKFIPNAIANGCPEGEANLIWTKIERTAGYQFNRAHAITYSILGYIGQWLKVYYPMEFWSVSLRHSNDDEIRDKISEINKLGDIVLLQPDINKSSRVFMIDHASKSLYWSINKIKFVGNVAVDNILREREQRGRFFSFSDFFNRVDRRKVNKKVVFNLILSGCFDEVEKIKILRDRKKLLITYCQLLKVDLDVEYNRSDDCFWYLKQREISGSGVFDFRSLFDRIEFDLVEAFYLDSHEILEANKVDTRAIVVGVLVELNVRISKKGEFANIVLDQNNDLITVTLWSDCWNKFKQILLVSNNKIVAIDGVVRFDRWRNHNAIHGHEDSKIQVI